MFDAVEQVKKRYFECRDKIVAKENTMYSLIDLFIRTVLGYEVSSLNEVITQFTTGFSTKKDFFVDYAIIQNDRPIMLIEAKKLYTRLNASNEEQLLYYFNSSVFLSHAS